MKGINGMNITEVEHEYYGNVVDSFAYVFCQEPFLELNRDKADRIRYFVGREGNKDIFALPLGEKGREWKIPFSAPFGMPIAIRKKHISLESYYLFVEQLCDVAEQNEISNIEIFLPPLIYGEEYIQKFLGAFIYNGFQIMFQEMNYSLNLKKIAKLSYEEYMFRNARKNLTIGLNSELKLLHCETVEEKQDAYNVIKINRESKGYPLRMTMEQVMCTINIVKHDFFVVKKEGKSIAAAIIYYVTDNIAQVIYWGDIPDVGQYKPINFLSYKLTQFYSEKGIKYVDIGPSSEKGIPSYGLCDFKESIGCEATAKFRLKKELR